MAKYSTPGIRFTEIDNTIRSEAAPGMGIGAIVMKSNKGPVNQRVVTRNYNEFTEIFGEPETLTDYGHFAAENYFANSTQMYAVRATMGDEQYSQIQFSYEGAPVTATNKSKDTAKFVYVDNQSDNTLKLLSPLSAVTEVESMSADWKLDDTGVYGYAMKQNAYYGTFSDILSETEDLIVYKGKQKTPGNESWEGNITEYGYHVVYPRYVDSQGKNPVPETKLIFTESAWNAGSATSAECDIKKRNSQYYVTVSVPASATLNKKQVNINFYGEYSAVSGWESTGVTYKNIFNDQVFQGNFSGDWANTLSAGYGYVPAQRMEIMDWDDPEIKKTFYVDSTFSATTSGVSGLKYTEFFSVDPTYALFANCPKIDFDPTKEGKEAIMTSAVSDMYLSTTTAKLPQYGNDEVPARSPKDVIIDMLDAYSCNDISDINDYTYLKYYDPTQNAIIEKIVKETPKQLADEKHQEKYLFWLYAGKGENKLTKAPVYIADDTETVSLPIQKGYFYDDGTQEKTVLNNIVAQPSSYIFNSVDKTYADGYTIRTEAEDEPGNGDIEQYKSVFDDQLVIASIGPGKYGDDVGVSIITTECSEIAALNHQNAFNWKYAYDDEDKVNADTSEYNDNPMNLTWKKVFRINVYIKPKTQTAEAAWGFGMDALLKDPAESWFVSTDPYAKDDNGNSLYAPIVINGHSDYIYVSRASVNDARNGVGEYVQPKQTFAIYGLTGGKNSEKNNISEKTAALSLYTDRRRAPFDILFNVDAIDTFNGRQRYNAHQRKIAQIAGSRTMDIGVIQVTSKSAKTAKQMVSETKTFSFNKGDYVAQYAGYDKYYNAALASWIYLPKSVAGACAMAYCDTFAYPWRAPAGVACGTINYTNGQLLKLTDDEIGQLYDNNVNTSRDCGNYGVVLWGQKTALKKNSLLNRINVRRCLNYIEKRLENKMTPYLFMQNSVNTRASARNDIDSFLQQVKAAEGIERYQLSVTQDPEDPTIMNVNIIVYPTSAIEFIDVKIIINRSTVTVTEE
ncbi:MAG: hypothetical protein J6T10_17775 [Methanobrevibacter sp.]|nr:hypothetical protein [Methanobrevibacter sp.]